MNEQNSAFHAGEQKLHQQLGISRKMEKIGNQYIRNFMPEQHQSFYQQLPFIWLGFVDKHKQPWATALFNTQDQLVTIKNDKELAITFDSQLQDNKFQPSNAFSDIALLGIEPWTRRRNRLSVSISHWTNTAIELKVKQSFGNCPKYIQARQMNARINRSVGFTQSTRIEQLNAQQTGLIEQADTFYIASFYQGADISHRGGLAGFVKVEGNRILFPDYSGNQFFNTLGNIQQNGLAGLTFIEHNNGHMLQLTGQAKIITKHPLLAHFKGALRFVQFDISHGYWTEHAWPYTFVEGEQSPHLNQTGTWQQARQNLTAATNNMHNQLKLSPSQQVQQMFKAGLQESTKYTQRK
ncbi:oxidoreductase, FAD-binding protein [Catenovulum agarivorans DS-2]|uniref:Oxidoreductase, FAD-binding protein n=1 Tax=Catenovulum agarivorans DS-2 TaxID=1328313 RepID=W7QVC7_9ALTE|nr:pyridoxamine 5'-phosphate oxidase family protein [Catenovulum agarivorans]EWH11668.1 oxidoreductase, FAD-binding protein [Catenovulum agarivorans DS-2]